ncbi:MAG: metallophosphoesterase [Clostridiales bacterium]|nr:metallophosphoesterase [Clostridiales bacterium]
MRILIMSDSHGRSDLIYQVAALENPDMFIHLGDLEDMRDTVERRIGAPELPCIFIKGNCDFSSQGDLWNMSVFNLKGHKFYCTHGHLMYVNYNLEKLVYTAEENGCDIVLYGHTHVPFNEFLDGSFGRPKIHVLNPGSIALPRGGSKPSYMIMNLKDDGAYDVELKTL